MTNGRIVVAKHIREECLVAKRGVARSIVGTQSTSSDASILIRIADDAGRATCLSRLRGIKNHCESGKT